MSPRRILITGGSGFVGQWMCRQCLEHGDTVFAGTVDQVTGPPVLSIEQRASVTWLQLDTTSDEQIARAIEQSAPDRVVHLAAMAFAPDANQSPAKAFDVNALGALRLLTRLARSASKDLRVLVVGSAEQYGANSAATSPVPETVALAPLTVYAASKSTQELIAVQTARSTSLHVVCTRSFNHSGFGHGPQYLIPALVERARSLPPTGGSLRMGNTTPVRDYLHVRDVVAAYSALLEKGKAGDVYNVASGAGLTVNEIATRVLKRTGRAAEISVDPALVRPVDVPILVGDSGKLRAATGWAPQYTVDDIIDDLIHGSTR
ncbi:MAG TPA: GDP-mannose 4,6-dehydratase [Gemmatimonadaceae bacterium]